MGLEVKNMYRGSDGSSRLSRRAVLGATLTVGSAVAFGAIAPIARAEGPAKFELLALHGQTLVGTEDGSTTSLPTALGCRIRVFDEDIEAGVRLFFKWDRRCYRSDTLSLTGPSGTVTEVLSRATVVQGNERSAEVEVSDSLLAGTEYVLLLGAAITPTLEAAVPGSARGPEIDASVPGDTASADPEVPRSTRGATDFDSQWGVKIGVVWQQNMWGDSQFWVWEPASVVVTAHGGRETPSDLKIRLELDSRYSSGEVGVEPYTKDILVGSLEPDETKVFSCEIPELSLSGDLHEFSAPVVSCVSVEGFASQVLTGQESCSREDSVLNAAMLEFFLAG